MATRQVQLSIPALHLSVSWFLSDIDPTATPELIAAALKRGEFKIAEIIKTEREIEIP